MKALWKQLKSIPRYGWICGAVLFVLQFAVYRFGNFISEVIGTAANPVIPKIPFLDDKIPVIAVFVVIYLFSYIFWIMGPAFASLTDKRHFINYVISLLTGYLIGLLFFIFMPTAIDREAEGLLQIAQQPGVFNQLLGIVYNSDGGARGFNLFPSYHCLISAFCYLGIRKCPQVLKGVRIYSLVLAILISLSTVFTKQHYILDVFGGIGFAVITYAVINKLDPAGKILAQRQKKKEA